MLGRSPDSWRPIPVVLSLSFSSGLSRPTATASMEEWLTLIDGFVETTLRNVPTLWIGPVAAGQANPPGEILTSGRNALWHYTTEMSKEAIKREMESLGMYNLTLQATVWDGSSYGEKVALVQAMMVCHALFEKHQIFMLFFSPKNFYDVVVNCYAWHLGVITDLFMEIVNWLSRLETT